MFDDPRKTIVKKVPPPPPWKGRPVRFLGIQYKEVKVDIMDWPAYKKQHSLTVQHVRTGAPGEPVRIFVTTEKEGNQ